MKPIDKILSLFSHTVYATPMDPTADADPRFYSNYFPSPNLKLLFINILLSFLTYLVLKKITEKFSKKTKCGIWETIVTLSPFIAFFIYGYILNYLFP